MLFRPQRQKSGTKKGAFGMWRRCCWPITREQLRTDSEWGDWAAIVPRHDAANSMPTWQRSCCMPSSEGRGIGHEEGVRSRCIGAA